MADSVAVTDVLRAQKYVQECVLVEDQDRGSIAVLAGEAPLQFPELRRALERNGLSWELGMVQVSADLIRTAIADPLSHARVTWWRTPSDDLEVEVRRLVAAVVDEPGPVSMDDLFADLGGDSLSALELAASVEARWPRAVIEFGWLVREATVLDVAESVRANARSIP